MKLNLKIPTFYRNRYGSDSEVDEMCELICDIASSNQYAEKVEIVDFIPVIIPQEMIDGGKGKEFTKIDLKYKAIALSRQVNFEKYSTANITMKKEMIVECLMSGLMEVKNKIKLDIKTFRKDIDSVL